MNTTSVTSGAGTSTLPEHLSSPLLFNGVHVTWFLVLCVCFVDRYLSFVLFPLVVVLSVLRFTDSDCPFGIFNLFLIPTLPYYLLGNSWYEPLALEYRINCEIHTCTSYESSDGMLLHITRNFTLKSFHLS